VASPFVPPRSPLPPPGASPPPAAAPDPQHPTPGQAAAAIATGVLCLWTPFTLIIGLFLTAVPDCAGSHAAICTPLGHLTAVFGGVAGAVLGLAIVVVGCWVHPRRDHAYWAFAALAVAGIGFLGALGLIGGAPDA
jgi:hypothetical protein